MRRLLANAGVPLLFTVCTVLALGAAPPRAEAAGAGMYAVCTGDAVNVRAMPDLESRVVGRVWRDVAMTVHGFDAGWVQVEFTPGHRGWIRGEFVKTVSRKDFEALTEGGEAAAAAPPAVAPETYRIQVGDSLAIRSFRHEALNDNVWVRTDGYISLVLLDSVRVVGMTPGEVDRLLTEKYKKHFRDPDISVLITDSKAYTERKVFVGGAVGIPKEIPLSYPMTLLQAVFSAGGFKREAKKQEILIIRKGPDNQPVYRFVDLRNGGRGDSPDQKDPYLKPFDIIIVPERGVIRASRKLNEYAWDFLPKQMTLGFSYFKPL